MSVPFSSFPWILASPESGQRKKRKRWLTLTIHKKPFRYRLPASPPRKRTKISSSTPNLKFPLLRHTKLCLKVSIYQFCRTQLAN
jgi:hypothetical protein